MKNISFYINTLSAAGGTQRVLTSLVNLLVQDYNITIIINDNKEPFFKINPAIIIKHIAPQIKNKPLYYFNLNKSICNELKNNSCDYYISLDSNSVLLHSFFLPAKTKLVIWEHFSLSKNFNKLLYKFSRFYASKRAHYMVLLSKQEIKDWSKTYHIASEKLKLIYNPITISEELDFLNIDLYNNKKVLAIGNNINVKGFDYLVKAWSLLDKNDWTLEIVGLSENEQTKLRDIISNLDIKNKIIITGRISNIKEKYLESSIYCLCSRMEATPLVLIESQYLGLPAIIFNNCEGPLELLNNSGLIVDFEDIDAYAKALLKLINSKALYSELANNARINANRFNNKTFYEKWRTILN